MNILIFNYEYPPLGGGGGVATKQLAETLAHRHKVFVVTSKFGSLPSVEIKNNVQVYRVQTLRRTQLPTATLTSMITFVFSATVCGIMLAKKCNFNVINAQFVVPSGIPAAIVASMFRIPLVVSFIGGDVYDPTKGISPHRQPIIKWLIRRIAMRAEVCTAISSDTKERAHNMIDVSGKILITSLGINPSSYAAADRSKYDIPREVFLVTTVGRLIERKGYQILIESWRKVPDAHLAIIGSGPLQAELVTLIYQYHLQDRVHLVGQVSDQEKLQLLAASNMFVSAAKHEGFGLVFLEAMQAGLPIVATNVGGQNDILKKGVNALLVPPNNDRELTVAINELIQNNTLRDAMAQQNKNRVKDFYLDKTTGDFEKILIKASHHEYRN